MDKHILYYEDGTLIYLPSAKMVVLVEPECELSGQDADSLIHSVCNNEHIVNDCRMPDHYVYPGNSVEILLTDKCNLICRYCFANSTATGLSMPTEKVFRVIDYVFANVEAFCALGMSTPRAVHIGFTGGGEPTTDMSLLLEAMNYIHAKEEQSNITTNVTIQTNGQFESKYVSTLKKAGCDQLILSMDGSQSVQETMRPRYDGKSSFLFCSEIIKAANTEQIPISIHSVLSKQSLKHFPTFVEYIAINHPNIQEVFFDVITKSGRNDSPDSYIPQIASVRLMLHEVRAAYRNKGPLVRHPFSLMNYGAFCGAYDKFGTIYVSPDGAVSRCQEGDAANISNIFDPHVGCFADNTLYLQKRSIRSGWDAVCGDLDCVSCLGLYICAGGCKCRMKDYLETNPDKSDLYWCEMAKELILQELYDCVRIPRLYPDARRFTKRTKLRGQDILSHVVML